MTLALGACLKYWSALAVRTGGRAVECTALEMRHTGNRIGSSNLPLSASNKAPLRGLFCFQAYLASMIGRW